MEATRSRRLSEEAARKEEDTKTGPPGGQDPCAVGDNLRDAGRASRERGSHPDREKQTGRPRSKAAKWTKRAGTHSQTN